MQVREPACSIAARGPRPAPGTEERMTSPAHEHDWRQRAVLHEDGFATEEYACVECGGVTFR